MRIISQDEKLDIPYEQEGIQLLRYDDCGFAVYTESLKLLGVYSTLERAKKTMELLREAYMDCNYINSRYSNESGVVETVGYVANGIFQMPNDEDVEGV